jgi:hypothetical protein
MRLETSASASSAAPARLDAEGGEHFGVEAFLVIGERHVVDRRDVERLDDGGSRARCRTARASGARLPGSARSAAHQQDVGLDADRAQFLHRMLRRLGLQLAGAGM